MSHTLLTGAHGFIGKYILHKLQTDGRERVVTLGLDERNDITIDLTKEVTDESAARFNESMAVCGNPQTVIHAAGSCFARDPRAVNVAATRNLLRLLDGATPENFVFLSSVEVYGRKDGENWSEADIADPDSPVGHAKLAAEEMLSEWCRERDVKLTILRLPLVVGTGMEGPLRKMVNRIYRGTYQHVAGNEARLSVVHATDVAKAVIDLGKTGGTFNLTDGVNPTVHDLAEAFAHRLNDKRIMTLSEKRARRWALMNDFIPGSFFTRQELKRMITTLTFSSVKAQEAGWQPQSVTEYLLTHDYENDPF